MRLTFFIIALITSFTLHGQVLKGIVTDGETNQPLYLVYIADITNGQSGYSDERGIYTLSAKNGDLISYSFTGYHTAQRLATTDSVLRVSMFPLNVHLQEFVLHPEYTPYQRDSAEMAALYSDQLNPPAPIKPGYSNANGGGFTGLIGGAVQKISHSYKQKKKFKKNFINDEEQKYIDTRYTPELVTTLTGVSGDTLAIFMNTYPMEYTFARSASDLEMKIWIRDNYRDYLAHPKNNELITDPAKKQ